MAPIPVPEIEALARLARLHLEPDEITAMATELEVVLRLMDEIRQLDLEVPPMTDGVRAELPLRPDRVESSLPLAIAMKQAPRVADDHFEVPAVIEKP